jgi:Cu(I)/Ag(I) efflux system membrane fusion protein
MKNSSALIVGLMAGVIVTVLLYTFVVIPSSTSEVTDNAGVNEPLYWVAPMDPNFRKDKPGKSPMGMDLVPVYAEDNSKLDSPGTVKIQPNIVNNLGVRTATAKRRALNVPIKTVGYVRYNEDTLIHIHPRVEGWLETLYVKAAGEFVTKGDPLYGLYSPQLVNAQEEFLLAVKRSNKNLMDAAKSRLHALQMPEVAIKKLVATEKVQQTVIFQAPQTGFVDNLNVREGFFVKPGTTIMSIGALDKVWVEAEVFERQSSQIKVGLPVTMTLDYLPTREWLGKVDYVYPTLDQSTRTLKVRLRLDNKDYLLKPNMFAQVTIHSELSGNNVIVPTESVIRTGTQDRIVLALGDGKFKSIQVKVGNVINEYTEILSGVREGDEVVTSAQFLLDSESSINSDFKRMEQRDTTKKSVWTKATINKVMPSQRIVNLDHPAIEDWNWPSMTMDFTVAQTVSIEMLEVGLSLHVEISESENTNYTITAIHIMDDANKVENQDASQSQVSMARVKGVINSINLASKTLNISRDAIPKWNRGPATLDFTVSESIDIQHLIPQQSIDFTFEVRDGNFVIVELMPIKNEAELTDHSGHGGSR